MTSVLVALLALAAQSKNPEYDHWAHCKVGSWTKLKAEGDVQGQKVTMDSTHTLLELTEEKAVVERKQKRSVAGKEEPEESERAPVPSGNDPDPIKVEKQGDEEIEVAGKKLKCHWVEGTQGEMKVKMWLSKEIPGGIARGEMSIPGAITLKIVATSWEKK